MNTGTCKSDEGDETHAADRSQEFFEDAFPPCLYEIDASTQVSDINIGFETSFSPPDSTEDRELAPLDWIRSLHSLPPGSSSDSSNPHQRHDSSNSSGSDPLNDDIITVDENQFATWAAEKTFQSDDLGIFMREGALASRNRPTGGSYVTYQHASAIYTAPCTSRVTSSAALLKFPEPPFFTPSLEIGRILDKSRVETQIPVTLKMQHMPEGIKRIHFPPSSISKAKLLTRPPPPRSPDMLEMHVALVCTSAMYDLTKRKLALNREAGRNQQTEGACNLEEQLRPLDGGRVDSCSKCIDRERKRASRKTIKNIEEEEAWQCHEAHRIIVFNIQEVIELPDVAAAQISAPNGQSGNMQGLYHRPSPAMLTPTNISLPMRITCYCRHHEEKIGFQVIFTLKDYNDNLVVQGMTSSIMITDDHKTHSHSFTTPSPGPVYPGNSQFPGVGVFHQQPQGEYPPLPIRQIHSATDLHRLRQGLASSVAPYTLTAALPTQDIVTATPSANLSRPVSPSAKSGRTQKRRKANEFGAESSKLVTTYPQNDGGRIRPGPNALCGDPASALPRDMVLTTPKIYGVFPPAAIPSSDETLDGVFHEPSPHAPTPLFSGHGLLNSPQRSRSVQHLVTFPYSAYPHNPPSGEQILVPNFVAQYSSPPVNGFLSDSSTSAPSEEPSSADSSLEMQSGGTPTKSDLKKNTWPDFPPSPEIIRIIPGEGPKSGGIEVTFVGAGFYPGLSILFGDIHATVSLHHSATCIVCILPPVAQACIVEVRCNFDYRGLPPGRKVYFKYFDNDEAQLIRLALTILHHKTTGEIEDAGAIARKMVELAQKDRMQQNVALLETGGQLPQANSWDHDLTDAINIEARLLRLLDMIDLDDSINQPRFNKRNSNGHTMLHLSASLGFKFLAAALLARGANPDLRDKNGMSPMHMASLNNHTKILLKLRSVGGDPTLRSLRGYTPLDFALTEGVRNVITAVLEGCSPSSSFASAQSPRRAHSGSRSPGFRGRSKQTLETPAKNVSDALTQSQAANVASRLSSTFSPKQTRSSRNSVSMKPPFPTIRSSGYQAGNERFFAAIAAWSVWRDQLTNQLQQLQQSIHRAFPNLPTPNFPPIPNLPGYQDITVVRLLLGLVPQINLPSIARDSKDHDYHWWDLLKGSTAPPPYEELYPSDKIWDGALADSTAIQMGVNSPPDLRYRRGAAAYGCSSIPNTSNARMTPHEQRSLISAHEMKVKRLRSDRNLFFFWIPLLVLVLILMLKDGVPQAWSMLCDTWATGRRDSHQNIELH